MLFAEVVLDDRISEKEQFLLYSVPKNLEGSIKAGQIVLVPFGRIQKRGIIINIKNKIQHLSFRLRNIKKITFEEPVISEKQVLLAEKISSYYFTPLYKVIKLFVPSIVWFGDHKQKQISSYKINLKKNDIKFSDRSKKQQNLFLDILNLNEKELLLTDLKKLESYSYSLLQALLKKEIILSEKKSVRRNPLEAYEGQEVASEAPVLSSKQRQLFEKLMSSKKEISLIRGVTGSGKTEIYISLVEEMRRQNKSVIILIPEINLTPQNIKRFLQYFPGQIAMWHSRLNEGEKFDEWSKIKNGEKKIIIGSRSALFTPVENLGAIIIDEEHDQSYKQNSAPRYQSKKVALFYSEIIKQCKVVLGSATPSIESYYWAKKGFLNFLEIEERFSKVELPEVKVINLSHEKKSYHSIIGYKLSLEIAKTLEAKEQVILLLNKRGFHNSLQCLSCGNTLSCDRCDIPYVIHKKATTPQQYWLRCHYCSKESQIPATCPVCKGAMMKGCGFGTQIVEEELKKMFPQNKILRADTDSMSGKNKHKEIYDKFYEHGADILIGTQMVSKGWDIPNVSLVGILLADIGLHMPDFRATEKSFQLFTQVAGRAGRREKRGRVLIQTYSPTNLAVEYTKEHDYKGFFEEEIKKRREYNYPPFCHLLKLEYVHESLERAKQKAYELSGKIKDLDLKIDVLGPVLAPIPKIYNKYHYQILIKAQERKFFKEIIKIIEQGWRINVDPQ